MTPMLRSTLLAAALLAGCADDDPAPSVSVREATPDELRPDDDRLDDLTITVDYVDADGDLGGGVAEVHDCRGEGLVTALPIPAIAADAIVDEMTRITGALVLHVNDVGAVTTAALPAACDELGAPAPAPEATVFCVVLVDAAGHRGVGDCTPTITLTP